MSETWGIVLRDRATGAEQWVACEVTRDGDIVTARAHGHEHRTVEYAKRAVDGVARLIELDDRTLEFVRIETPAQYTAHMENLRRILATDDVERLRVAVAERDATIADLHHASNRAAVAYAESLARCEAEAFRRGAEAMREAATREAMRGNGGVTFAEMESIRDVAMKSPAGSLDTPEARINYLLDAYPHAGACELVAWMIRRLPLPAYAPSQPAQVDEATETRDAPLTIADAAARARRAAAQRAR